MHWRKVWTGISSGAFTGYQQLSRGTNGEPGDGTQVVVFKAVPEFCPTPTGPQKKEETELMVTQQDSTQCD